MAKNRTFSIKDVQILDNEACYDGFMSIDRLTLKHRLFDGGWSPAFTREVVSRRPGVGVLLYDPRLDKVLMVEQFRAGCLDDARGPWVLELVAGTVEEGESSSEVAIREAKEEANVSVRDLLPVCQYYNSPGGSNEKLDVFCARVDANARTGVFGLREEHEDIRTVLLSRQEAQAAIQTGKINNAMAIIALQWLALNLETVRGQLQQPGQVWQHLAAAEQKSTGS